jgi:Beta/Gamma crystallin/Ricin-type beta-trefoil lectin domain
MRAAVASRFVVPAGLNFRRSRTAPLGAAALLAALLGASSETEADATLYKNRNFGGASRTIAGDTPDLGALGFDNETSSLKIDSGSWILYRDRNFQGRSITLGPGDYPNLEALGFPNDRLSSIRLLPANGATTTGLVAAPKITLYKARNFGGARRDITGEAADLDQLGFDNEASSLIVHSGTWTLYRNPNFGETPDRPSVTVGPGEYPDIEALGFPDDKLSSLRGAPEATGAVACGEGAEPDAAGASCVCKAGFAEVGRDDAGRLRCAASTAGLTNPGAPTTLAPVRTALPAAFINAADARCIDATAAIGEPGAALQLAECGDLPAQRFAFLADGHIRAADDRCLTTRGGVGDAVRLGDCAGTRTSTWVLDPNGALAPSSGGCAAPSTEAGTTILRAAACKLASPKQHWRFGTPDAPAGEAVAGLDQPSESGVEIDIDYLVSAGEAFLAAAQKGFLFRSNGSGDCLVYGDIDGILLKNETTAVPTAAATNLGTADCGFSLFGGRSLKTGWRITRTDLTDRPAPPHCGDYATYGPGSLWAASASPFEPEPGLMVWSSIQRWQVFVDLLHPEGCVRYPLRITKITLRGPSGHDWRDAFAPD